MISSAKRPRPSRSKTVPPLSAALFDAAAALAKADVERSKDHASLLAVPRHLPPSPTSSLDVFIRSQSPSPSPHFRPFTTSAPQAPPLSARRLEGLLLHITPPPPPPWSPLAADSIDALLDLGNDDDAHYDGEHQPSDDLPDLPPTPSSDVVLMAPPQHRHHHLVFDNRPAMPILPSRSELEHMFNLQQQVERQQQHYNDRDRRPRDRSLDEY